jgi:DNA-binding NarL/FixJ family response regulator
VIALTRHNAPALVKELLAAGAMGYVLKQSSPAELLKAIRAAAAGNQYIDASLRERDLGTSRRPPSMTLNVTDRERQVLRRMALGHSNKDIAS